MNFLRNRDLIGGSLVLIVGLFFFIGAFEYPMGTLRHMGSGLFPLGLGVILTVLGAVVATTAFRTDETLPSISWRALIFVSAGIAAFGIGLEVFGLLPAVAAAIFAGALGDPEVTPKDIAIMVVLYVAMAYAIFILSLGLPLPAIGTF